MMKETEIAAMMKAVADVVREYVGIARDALTARINDLDSKIKASPDVEKLIAGVHDYIGRALAPFAVRVKALEDRAPERGEKGKDADPLAVMALVDQRVALAVQAIPPAATGPKGDKGEPGESIRGEKGDPGESIRGERGEAGKDAIVDQALLRSMVGEEAIRAVAAFPKPADGKNGASFVAGEGPPLFEGKAGDVYLDSQSGSLYRCG